MTCSPRFRTSLMSELIPSPSLQMSPSTAPQSGWRSISSDLRWPWVALTMRRWDNSVLAWSGATCFRASKARKSAGNGSEKSADGHTGPQEPQEPAPRVTVGKVRSRNPGRPGRPGRKERRRSRLDQIRNELEMELCWTLAVPHLDMCTVYSLWDVKKSWAAGTVVAHGCTWLHMVAHGCTWLHMVAHGCTWLHMVAHGCTWLHWENQCLWEVPCDYCTCNMCHVLRTMTECLMREFAAQFKKSLSCIPLKSCGMRSPFVSCPEESGLRSFVQQESCLQVGGEKQTMSFRELN